MGCMINSQALWYSQIDWFLHLLFDICWNIKDTAGKSAAVKRLRTNYPHTRILRYQAKKTINLKLKFADEGTPCKWGVSALWVYSTCIIGRVVVIWSERLLWPCSMDWVKISKSWLGWLGSTMATRGFCEQRWSTNIVPIWQIEPQ